MKYSKAQLTVTPDPLYAIIMIPCLVSILIFLAVSCKSKTNDWQTLNFGQFKLNAPADWIILKEKGVDSYVGGLTNRNDTLWFDYGAHDLNIAYGDSLTYLMAVDTVNGLKANIFLSDKPDDLVMMQIPFANNSKVFFIGGRSIKNTEMILDIFKSVSFIEGSDMQHNPDLTRDKFEKIHCLSANTLILMKCGSCHMSASGYKSFPLKEFIQSRSFEWLFNFLKNKSQLKSDAMYIKRRQANQIHCPEFPDLTKADIIRIKELYN